MEDQRCTIEQYDEETDVLTGTTKKCSRITVTAPSLTEARKHFDELRRSR